jgi:membrane protease YdiL (CAAX protease family)
MNMEIPLEPRLLTLLLIAPVAEEIAFRVGLQEQLLRRLRAPAVANALTAFAFGLVHVLAQARVAAFAVALPALAIGAVYQRRRRLGECVALHASLNAIWIVWALNR